MLLQVKVYNVRGMSAGPCVARDDEGTAIVAFDAESGRAFSAVPYIGDTRKPVVKWSEVCEPDRERLSRYTPMAFLTFAEMREELAYQGIEVAVPV